MRKLKFRGRDVGTGKYVYAELGEISVEINPGYLLFITKKKIRVVERKSIEQLIGVDSNGQEVYEGDKVLRHFAPKSLSLWPEDGLSIFTASFKDFADIEGGQLIKIAATEDWDNGGK